MSRIGKKPVTVPKGVKITQSEGVVKVEGPKGKLSSKMPEGVVLKLAEGQMSIERVSDDRLARSSHGLARTLISNMVTGVDAGFQKALEISGVGYRAELAGSPLKLALGFSAPVEYSIPKGVTVAVDKQVNLVVSGINKELVGRVAAEIRALKKPEPYKGKGIKYVGERVRRKAGKAAGAK